MSHRFGKEKFFLALLVLVAPGDIRSRVSSALSQHLLHIAENEDIPEKARSEYIKFKNSLQLDGAPTTPVADVIHNMSEVEAEKIAQKIVELYEKVIVG